MSRGRHALEPDQPTPPDDGSGDTGDTGDVVALGDRPLRVADLLAQVRREPSVEPATESARESVAAEPVQLGDLLVALGRPTNNGANDGAEEHRHGAERSGRLAALRAAVPALVRQPPLKVRRPVLVAAIVMAAAAATAAAALPATQSHQTATHARAHVAAAGPVPRPAPVAEPQNVDVPTSGAPTRVSRNTRKPLMKPGQTVPGTWILPAPGVITTCFCMRWGVMHEGIDIAKGYGVPIHAVGDGVVLEAGPAEGFGQWVVLQHSNGDVTIYGHVESYSVHAGEHVKAGQVIALEGSEGQSTGPHLHFQVNKGGLTGPPIDPVPWLKARGVKVPPSDYSE